MVEINRKIDLMNEREVVTQQKFENLQKSLGRVLNKVYQVKPIAFSLSKDIFTFLFLTKRDKR